MQVYKHTEVVLLLTGTGVVQGYAGTGLIQG